MPKQTSPVLSVVIPVYNERDNIVPSVTSIVQAFGAIARETEILFVDDNSPDGTAAEVDRVAAATQETTVRLVQHGKKEGIGAAHHAGYDAAKGKYIMCLDADLSQNPSDLLRMKAALDSGLDVVIGSRYVAEGEQVGKTLARDWGSKGMNALVRLLLGISLADSTHTFRAFKRTVHETISSHLNQKGHPSFQIQFLFWAVRKGFRVGEIPIKFVERAEGRGQSKISIRRELPPFFKLLFRLLATRISQKTSSLK